MSKLNGHDNDYDQKNDNVLPFEQPQKPEQPDRFEHKKLSPPPLINLPPFTKALCLLLLVFGVIQLLAPEDMIMPFMIQLAMIPARVASLDVLALPTFVTHMFLHGGWLHLLMNVLMLAAFGAGLEKAIGAKRTAAIFFLSGVIGALAHFAVQINSPHPLIGASGGVSGLFGALCYWMTQNNMLQNQGRGLKALLPLIIIWVVTSIFFGMFGMPGAGGMIAWVTHVAGFLAGIVLYHLIVVRRLF